MEQIFNGTAGKLHISAPELYIDNQARGRSGHMTHAMVEYQPGKILDFNSNCSPLRCNGHSAFGFVEYRYSEDAGKTWGETHILPCSMKTLLDGIYSLSVEKAVACNGVITAFLLRNTQARPICCEPWDTPYYTQSYDFGKTWTESTELSPYAGRIYDAVVHNNSIFVLQHCCPHFYALPKEQLNTSGECVELTPDVTYRILRSDDNGKTFYDLGPADTDMSGHAYGALQFRPDNLLILYSCNILNGSEIGISVSSDSGKTWKRMPACQLAKGIRNIQVGMLDGKYVMHGRGFTESSGWNSGLVVYTSKDGLSWDEGLFIAEKKTACYYSNNLALRDASGKEKLLMQYSDTYELSRVNVMHRWLSFE